MNFRFTISSKLLLGFGLLILAILINGIITFVSLDNSRELLDKKESIYTPSISLIKDLNLILIRSKTLTINWLSEFQEGPERDALKRLHNTEYPAIEEQITTLNERWEHEDKEQMKKIAIEIDSIFSQQHDIMIKYNRDENYWTPMSNLRLRNQLKASFESGDYHKKITVVLDKLGRLINSQKDKNDKFSNDMNESFYTLKNYVQWLGFIIIIGGIFISYFTIKSIVSPVNKLKEVLLIMGSGILPTSKMAARQDEIGEMTNALNNLVSSLKRTSSFAKEIGEGNFRSEYHPLGKDDILGNSLIIMRDNLASVAEEDRKRSWTTEGLAKFGEILRQNSDNVKSLTESVISELVNYLEGNQGGVFVINNESDIPYLELSGCYAWDRQKYLEKKIYIGEGLVGQAWQERNSIEVTDVPENYINITSGLGSANPRSILITPMKLNDEVFGVIEIASFNFFEDYQIKFVEKLAETIASTISSVKVNQRTKNLLEQAQKATAQMKSQEEELRHNQTEMKENQVLMEKSLEEHSLRIKSLKQSSERLKEENSTLQNLLLKTSKELEKYRDKYDIKKSEEEQEANQEG